METDVKRLIGKLLGELYRLQRRVDPNMCSESDAKVYGLLNGFEHVIDEQITLIGWTSDQQVEDAAALLNTHWSDPGKLAAFKGFYDIERDLQQLGIDRVQAIKIIRYFAANHQFQSLISKMDSQGSPSECRKFELDEWDR